MMFTADYPGAIVVPADERNYYGPASGRAECVVRALVYHTPEEPSDDRESTPVYFASYHPFDPATGFGGAASTRFYSDNDGDVYQMVPFPWGAVANGLDGKPAPYWAEAGSLNQQTDNIEIEGYAATLKDTMTSAQFASLVDWSVWGFVRWGLPLEEGRMMGHYELSGQRSDPGPWLLSPQSGFKQEVIARVTEYEKKIKQLEAENETRKGEIQQMFGTIYGNPFGDAKGVIPRVEALERKP